MKVIWLAVLFLLIVSGFVGGTWAGVEIAIAMANAPSALAQALAFPTLAVVTGAVASYTHFGLKLFVRLTTK